MSMYRAGGCTAAPIKTTTVPALPAKNTAAMPHEGQPNHMHIESQTEHGLHCRSEPLPPAAVKAGWKK